MTAHPMDDQATRDRQAQARLERMLAARRAAEAAREARYRQLATPRSQFRAGAKMPLRDVIPVRQAPSPPAHFAWRDAATFLTPIAIAIALFLLAHWSGWLS